jgi:phage tail-like protein
MPKFTVNPGRIDPYKNFKFRVMWDGRYVAGVSRMSALTRRTDAIEFREGGDPSTVHKSPGVTKYDAIALERGITHDTDFERWANKVWNIGGGFGSEVSLKDFRKNVAIDLFNEAGQLVLRYVLYRCWVSEYQALPELDADSGCIAIERIVLQHEGWERDLAVTEPVEPSFDIAAKARSARSRRRR